MELKAPKYISSLTEKEAEIFLFEPIGEGGTSGQDFADEIQLLNQFGVENINVHINTGGGEVVEGQGVFAAMLNSDAHITTIIEGTVASMGAIIAMAGDTIKMTEFARLMIHGPRINEDRELTTDEQSAVNAMRGSLEVILKSRTGKNKTEVASLLEGNDTWLTPAEALEGKFIDEIVTIKHLKEAKRQPKSTIHATLKSIINKEEPTKTDTMKNLCAHLSLTEGSTEQSIIEAVKKIEAKLKVANESLQTATDEGKAKGEKITALEITLKGFQDAKVESEETILKETVEAYVKEGKVEKDKVEDFLTKFKGNREGLVLALGDLKVTGKAPTVTDTLIGNGTAGVIPEDKKDWSWRKIEADAPELAKKIMSDHVETYKVMYKTEYGIDAPVATVK